MTSSRRFRAAGAVDVTAATCSASPLGRCEGSAGARSLPTPGHQSVGITAIPRRMTYEAHLGFRCRGQMTDVPAADRFAVAGQMPPPARVPTFDVDLHGDAVRTDRSGLHLKFTDAGTGEPGAHRLFAQFRLADGRVITGAFVVHAGGR